VARDSLKKAIDVIDAAADFLADTKRVILVSVLHFFLNVIVLVVWLAAFLCVLSLNDIEPSKIIPQDRDIKWK